MKEKSLKEEGGRGDNDRLKQRKFDMASDSVGVLLVGLKGEC